MFEDRRMPPVVVFSVPWDMRSEKQWAPGPAVLASHCCDLAFSQGDGCSLRGVMRRRIGHPKDHSSYCTEKEWVARMAAGSERKAGQRVPVETKGSDSIFSVETLGRCEVLLLPWS